MKKKTFLCVSDAEFEEQEAKIRKKSDTYVIMELRFYFFVRVVRDTQSSASEIEKESSSGIGIG
jgi:hypothetical protein